MLLCHPASLRLYKDIRSKPSTLYVAHLEYNLNVIEIRWLLGRETLLLFASKVSFLECAVYSGIYPQGVDRYFFS